MASTVLPNGIIIPEKYSRDWYADLYHNWQELDNLLGGGTPKDGTLTIQKNGDTVGTFSANQATDETINIEVPDVNNGTLTIQQNGNTVGTFSANSSSDKTANVQCVDLTNNQTVGGNKEFTGTTTAHDLVPSATDTYNFGSSSYQWNNAYIKSLTINGVACGDILTHNASEFVDITGEQTIDGGKNFTSLQKMKSLVINPTATIRKEMYGSSEVVIGPYGAGTVPESSINPFRFYVGKARNYASAPIVIDTGMSPTGSTSITLRVASNESENALDHRLNIGTSVTDDSDGVKIRNAYVQFYNTNELRPNKNNYCNLGTPLYKWKDCNTNAINGINPGALSLPGTSVNVDTTNWVLDGTVNVFTPTSDGWFGIQATDTVYDQMHYVFVGRTDDGNTYYQQNVLSPINALWDGEYHGCIFIPVVKNSNYDIRCICSTIVATFYPCQGNV